MKNKFIKLFLVLTILVVFVGCGKTNEEIKDEPKVEVNNNDALIWEVKSDTATVYLVGSIHVADDKTYPLQEKILDAYELSDAIAVECDVTNISPEITEKMSEEMVYTDGTTIKDHISEETYNLLVDYVKKYGISYFNEETIDLLLMFKPWAIDSLLSDDMIAESDLDSENGIDVYFINKAKEDGKGIIEVESVEFQMNMLMNFSPEIQEFTLKNNLKTDKDTGAQTLKLMLELWEKGNVEAFEILLNDDTANLMNTMTEAEKKLYEEYNKVMIDDRNIGMTDKIEELLKGDQDVLYIVGSAHYFGDKGIINLLQNRGYTVEKK